MSERPLAIAVDSVHKDFRLAAEQRHTLKERVVNPRFDRSAKVFHALDDVSFDVRRGEFFGIVGRNGSGKSTLLKCMAGIYKIDSGSIKIGGRLSTFIELGVGFNPDLAARDNIILNGIMLGLTPKEAAERVDEVLAFAELEDHVDLKLKNYSSGMHVRLAFSVMTQVDADVLLIDEVLAVGDASFQAKCFDVFRQLREAGKTIVLVTHDMASVARFCDRAMLLEDGVVIDIGEPEVIGDQYLDLNFADHGAAPSPRPADVGVEPAEATAGSGPRAPVSVAGAVILNDQFREVRHVHTGAPLLVAIDVLAHEDGPAPSVTMELRDDQNITVFGSSTEYLKTPTGTVIAGERYRMITWLQVSLRPGKLRVRAVIGDMSSALVYDRTEDLNTVEVVAVEPVLGVAALQHEVSWRHVDDAHAAPVVAVASEADPGAS